MNQTAAVLTGLGAYVPSTVVTNADLAERLATSDEWVRNRTGIAQRHVAEPGVATCDLAVEAGARALKSAGVADADAVVVATTTPDRTCPSTAPEVASRLGLAGVAAFDVNAVCAGFVYALATGAGLLAAGAARRVLVVGSEVMTRIVDPDDRATAVLFGDGAGAVLLEPGRPAQPGAFGPFDLGSDGELADLLAVPAGGSRRAVDEVAIAEGADHLFMDGREVYRQAVRRMTESSRRVLDKAGLSVDDVDRFVGHQANARILEAVADRLRVPADKRVSNVARYGNTSAASIPLALHDAAWGEAAGDARLQPGHRVLLTSFGAGLSWGSTLLVWPQLSEA